VKRYLTGCPIVADSWSQEMWGWFETPDGYGWAPFRERIAHGAWKNIRENPKLTINHWEHCQSILARGDDRLVLFETERGLEFVAAIGTAAESESLWRQVHEGMVTKMSFMFWDDENTKASWGWNEEEEIFERTVTELGLIEHFACVVEPAYMDTTLDVALRMKTPTDDEARSVIARAEAKRTRSKLRVRDAARAA